MAFVDGFGSGTSVLSWSPSVKRKKEKVEQNTNKTSAPTSESDVEVHLVVYGARNLLSPTRSQCDVYAVVKAGSHSATTQIAKNTTEPQWNESLKIWIPCSESPLYATVEVYDSDPARGIDQILGALHIPLSTSVEYKRKEWFSLGRTSPKHVGHGELLLDAFIYNPQPISLEIVEIFRLFCHQRKYNFDVVKDSQVATSPKRSPQSTKIHTHCGQDDGSSTRENENLNCVDDGGGDDDHANGDPQLHEEDGSATYQPSPPPTPPHDEANANLPPVTANEDDRFLIGTKAPSDALSPSPTPPQTPTKVQQNPRETTIATAPGNMEELEVYVPNVILSTQSKRAIADIFISDFRLVVMCSSSKQETDVETENVSESDAIDDQGLPQPQPTRMAMEDTIDLSTSVPLGLISEVSLKVPKKQGRITSSKGPSDNGNEVTRAAIMLTVRCRDFRTLQFTFTASNTITPLQMREKVHAIHDRLQFVVNNMYTQPPALVLGCLDPHGWHVYDVEAEFVRQGALSREIKDGLLTPWRMCHVNEDYQVSPTYPRIWVVPRCLDDDTVQQSAAFRSKGRLPILCFYNSKVGNALVRCAQPMVGPTGRRSEEDEILVQAVRQISPDPTLMVIFDARSSLATTGNKLMGKGSEAKKNYQNTKVHFMEVQNIHVVRASADALRNICEEASEVNWLSRLEATGWLKQVHSVLTAGCAVARKMMNQKVSCLIHCSDGWDRTSQMTSICQLLIDGYFRTIDGFCVLIEKEWLSFGHMFSKRTFAPDNGVERSPIFLLFLDCVWQITQQFPEAFEFGERLLILLADHFQSGMFGNFLCDCEQERTIYGLDEASTSLWSHVAAIKETLVFHDYDPGHWGPVLVPSCSMKRITLWAGYFLRYDFQAARAAVNEDDSASDHNTIVWVPDSDAKACNDCGLGFTVVRRRHHCRACGRVFCGDCSQKRIKLPSFGYNSDQRVCDECYDKYYWEKGQRQQQRAEKYYAKS